MRYSLLDLVQRILEALESDEVNSYSDTTESVAVANIIKECYYYIVSEIEPKETQGIFHLDSSGDNTKPTLMYLPSNVSDIHWLKYNVGDTVQDSNFRDICYLPIDEFFQYMNGLNSDDTWVDSQDITIQGSTFSFKYRNDQFPSYYTCPDDKTILFDSFDSTVESTLQSNRTYGFGGLIPQFLMQDDFVPLLDARQFQLLLNSAKAQAFIELKQIENAKAERKERRHTILAYKTKDNTDTRRPTQKRKGFGR